MSMQHLYGVPASVSLERRPGTRISLAALEGEIDLRVHTQLRDVLAREVDDGQHLIVDLTRVAFLDSTGLGLLVGTLKRARERGERLGAAPTQLILVASGGDVARTLDITGLDRVFTIVPRVEDAESLL